MADPTITLTLFGSRLCATHPDGREELISIGPNTGSYLADLLRLANGTQPSDEAPGRPWAEADPLGTSHIKVTVLPTRARELRRAKQHLTLEDLGL